MTNITDTPLLSLDALPARSDSFVWADYIELLCFANADGFVSQADVLDRIRERKDLGGELDEVEEEVTEGSRLAAAEIEDKWTYQVIEWFEHLQYRANTFRSFYPFSLQGEGLALQRYTEISVLQKFYFVLLLASNLKYV
ncbi:hypothetical protein HC891_12145, partial [Candidatus Gracilibacteria bacterium]|nr:hypothetical protein [Candidatus Gracilibacteria bacterium]